MKILLALWTSFMTNGKRYPHRSDATRNHYKKNHFYITSLIKIILLISRVSGIFPTSTYIYADN
jgi:hypothetical protein